MTPPPPDRVSECLETIFGVRILKFFEADQGSGMEKIRILDGNNVLAKITQFILLVVPN
jgi:hypothetical protein